MKSINFRSVVLILGFVNLISFPIYNSEEITVSNSSVITDSEVSKKPNFNPNLTAQIVQNSSDTKTSEISDPKPVPFNNTTVYVVKPVIKFKEIGIPPASTKSKALEDNPFLAPIIHEMRRVPPKKEMHTVPLVSDPKNLRHWGRINSEISPVSEKVNPDKIVEELLEKSKTGPLTSEQLKTMQKYSYRIKKFVKPMNIQNPQLTDSSSTTPETEDKSRWLWSWFGFGGKSKPAVAINATIPSKGNIHPGITGGTSTVHHQSVIIKPRLNPLPGQTYYEYQYPTNTNLNTFKNPFPQNSHSTKGTENTKLFH